MFVFWTYMADTKRIRLYYEGDDDKVVLSGLQHMPLLPDSWEIARRDKGHPGKDGLVRELLPFVRPINGVGGHAVVLIDLDDLSRDRLAERFRKQLEEPVQGSDPPMNLDGQRSEQGRVTRFTITAGDRTGRVALVPVGLPEDEVLRATYAVDTFAMDDHIVRLVREQRVYAAVSELESVTHELAMRKMIEVAELLRKNGIAIHRIKRFLHILRAVAAVRPSSAVFIERLMKKAKETLSVEELRAIFHPLVDDLEEAGRMLTS
jgi:hypothetical protein